MVSSETQAEETLYCARHPSVETVLRCGRCETPICPRCLVMTPVGARCPDCARFRGVPMYNLRPRHYILATLTALVAGVALGAGWWWLIPRGLGLFFGAILGMAMGWLMFRAIDLVAPARRGVPLQVLAGLGLLIAYFLRNVLLEEGPIPEGDLGGVVVVGVAILVASTQLRD